MKRSSTLLSSLFLTISSTFLAGCLSTKIPLAYKPGPLPTPWEGRKPSLFIAKVLDRSNGVMISGPGASPKPAKFSKGLDESLKEALKQVLDRLEIPVKGSAKEADGQIQLIAREASAAWDAGFAVQDRGSLKLTLVVKDKNGRAVYNDEIMGNGLGSTRHAGCCPGVGPATAINDALSKAMGQIEDLFLAGDLAEQIFAAASPGVAPAPMAVPAIASDIDELPIAALPRRKGHAVVIGIERYRQQLPPADFAAGDARLVSKYLIQTLGFPAESVMTITNDGASRSDIEKYAGQWLKNRVEPGDEVFVYFSGHGSPNPVTGDAYLVPYDGDPTYLEQTGYSLKDLYARLGELPAGAVTVVLDSCFSGAVGRSVLAKGARPLVTVTAKPDLPANLTVLSAAAGNQISQSYQDKGHGLFTYFFLKGIGQQAAKGAVDLKAVYEYAGPQVTKIARQEYNTEQVPQLQNGRD